MNGNQSPILLLPFLQMPSGHHQVADTIQRIVNQKYPNKRCEKIDILSYGYGPVEKVVSSTYLLWIKRLPSLYHWLYFFAAYKERNRGKRKYVYEFLFLHYLKKLLQNRNPDFLFCTHALPSNLACVLKQKNETQTKIVNVYTDYFINRLWGLHGVDYHFVPSIDVKTFLLEKGVKEEQIFVTGIPVDPIFQSEDHLCRRAEGQRKILICGGSLGVGALHSILSQVSTGNPLHYYVLCGKNDQLYRTLSHENKAHITPFPFISCRHQMNDLYNQVDGVLTKPGGVTVTECIMKKKPLFIYEPLPGQERFNVQQLNKLGIIRQIDIHHGFIDKQLLQFFNDPSEQKKYMEQINAFHKQLDKRNIFSILEMLFA